MYRMELTLSTTDGRVVDETIIENKDLYILNCLQPSVIREFYQSGLVTVGTQYILHTLFEKEGAYEDSDELGVTFFYDPTCHDIRIKTEDGFDFKI